jgi:hypothetical protein
METNVENVRTYIHTYIYTHAHKHTDIHTHARTRTRKYEHSIICACFCCCDEALLGSVCGADGCHCADDLHSKAVEETGYRLPPVRHNIASCLVVPLKGAKRWQMDADHYQLDPQYPVDKQVRHWYMVSKGTVP